MNYNPYAAPEAPPPPAGVGESAVDGDPQPWTAQEVVSLAWERYKGRGASPGAMLSVGYMVSLMISGLVGQLPTLVMQGLGQALGVGDLLSGKGAAAADAAHIGTILVVCLAVLAAFVVSQGVGAFLQVGLTRMALELARDREPRFATLFSGADAWGRSFVCNLLFGLAMLFGSLLFVVPGVIAFLGFCFSQYYVVDAGMRPIEAMKASWRATRGVRGEVFVLALLSVGLVLLGLVMCCLGVLATAPLGMVAFSIAYTRASGRMGLAPAPEGWPQTYR